MTREHAQGAVVSQLHTKLAPSQWGDDSALGLCSRRCRAKQIGSEYREGFKRREELKKCRLLQFRARGIANRKNLRLHEDGDCCGDGGVPWRSVVQ